MRQGPAFRSNEAWQLFLLALRYREGDVITLGGNEPFVLSGDDAWIVYNGVVDLFSVQLDDGAPAGHREHFARLYTDQLFLAFNLERADIGLLVVCAPDTQLLRLSAARLQAFGQELEYADLVAALVEDWTHTLSHGIAPEVLPKDAQFVEAGSGLNLEAGVAVSSARGVVWVHGSTDACQFLGREGLPPLWTQFIPLTESVWMRTTSASQLEAASTEEYLRLDPTWESATAFYQFVLKAIAARREQTRESAVQGVQERLVAGQQRLQSAVYRLAGPWGESPPTLAAGKVDTWLATCQLVGRRLGVAIKPPPDFDTLLPTQDPVAEIARASCVRIRQVSLLADWWREDNGPLLGYLKESDQPVALLPDAPGRYRLYDLVRGAAKPIDAQVAGTLSSNAYMFYRPLPDDPLSARDLLRFGLQPVRRDLGWLLIVGLAGGLLGTLVPIITGLIFGQVIPAGDRNQLLLAGIILLLSGLTIAVFQVARGQALLRTDMWMGSAIQAAIWDRLLKLPPSFFRGYSAGDLTERAMSINQIRQILSDAVVLALISGIFSIFNFLILFVIDSQLALVVTGLVAALVAVTVILGQRIVDYERGVAQLQGELSGVITQLFNGIAKLRVAGAEGRSFVVWADSFSAQKKFAFRARSLQVYLLVILAAFPVLVSVLVFAVMARHVDLSVGEFLAFNAALALFLTTSIQLTGAALSALSIIPIYERLKPILRASPEIDRLKSNPGELSGAIEVSHVTFRYGPGSPVVLDDLSFSVRPGEFLAIVGPSGSGKSSLLRLLLGFETPEAGAIYYNEQALVDLDVRAVRRQIGVVLQHSQLMTGSIFSNIVGASLLTLDDAWEAARLVGIEDDVKDMPMGMQTFISEGGSTFSGGQRQRLLIARAMVTRPRIFFFDEATSALDDLSQATVTKSLKRMKATRLVIAHRLTTIIDADRILVIDHGRIVESGSYQELMLKDGLFAHLARRQLA